MTPRRSAVLLLLVIYLGFISLGLPDGTLGVAWPPIHTDLNLPIGLAGVIMIVATLLSATAAFSSGRIIARFQTGPVVFVSCLLTGSALLMVAQAQNLTWLLLAAIPLGFGAGAVDAGINGFVARHYSGRHMNWLHACWGIGATCGPLVMAESLRAGHGWRGGFWVLAGTQLSLGVIFLFSLRLWHQVPARTVTTETQEGALRVPTTPANSPAGWLSAAIFALYVGVEMTAGLWAGSILVVSRGLAPEHAARCVAGFYGAITVGRIGVGFVTERWGNRRMIAAGLALALVGGTLFVFAHTTPLAALALIAFGLGFSPVYPGLMHEVPRRFAPESVQVVIGRQSGASAIGAAIFPAAAGSLAEFSLEGIAWAVAVGVIALTFAIRRLNRLT